MNLEIIRSDKTLSNNTKKFIYIIAVLSSLFHLWVNTFGVIPEIRRNVIHYIFMLILAFLLYPTIKKRPNKFLSFDIICLLLALFSATYLMLFEDALHARNEVMILTDVIFATITLVILFEATRRTSGITIPILSTIFISYTLYIGQFFGGVWNFPGVTYTRLMYRMAFAPDGIFGSIATISSTFVILFVIFASFLLYSGAGDFIIKLALALMGKRVGGPAKIAIFASGLMGMISGSAVANTAAVGSITIPLMKKVGFKPEFAAAVEAAASTGGQILPPIMGAGAFVMSQWTGISYVKIALISLIPAIMYFLSIAFYIDLRARKRKLAVLSEEEIPNLKETFYDGWHYIIPILILIILLIYGFTPTYAAAIGIVSVVAVSFLRKSKRMTISTIFDALALGSLNMRTTGVILLCAGVIVEVIILSGLGLKFSIFVNEISGNSLFMSLIFIAIAATILGMGLPVTAAYIVLAVLSAPSILALMNGNYIASRFNIPIEDALNPQIAQGLISIIPQDIVASSLLAAHLAIFWFSQTSNVTPPVCLAAYSAAAIANANPIATGYRSMELAKGLYIIPFLFIYTPILFNGPLFYTIETICAATLGLFALAASLEGYYLKVLKLPLRLLFGIIGIMFLYPMVLSHLLGLASFTILSIIIIYHIKKKHKP
jgi:TRAP transporter 4TM/12TM fusion protein